MENSSGSEHTIPMILGIAVWIWSGSFWIGFIVYFIGLMFTVPAGPSRSKGRGVPALLGLLLGISLSGDGE